MNVRAVITAEARFGLWERRGRPLRARGGFFREHRAFTFLEVMVALAILASGLVLIYKSMLICLDRQRYLSARLAAIQILDEKTVVLQREYHDTAMLPPLFSAEIIPVTLDNQMILFELNSTYRNIDYLPETVEARMWLNWNQHGKTYEVGRSFYLFKV